jgi:hypothetical protein
MIAGAFACVYRRVCEGISESDFVPANRNSVFVEGSEIAVVKLFGVGGQTTAG